MTLAAGPRNHKKRRQVNDLAAFPIRDFDAAAKSSIELLNLVLRWLLRFRL